jgi:general secretion pathway protein N
MRLRLPIGRSLFFLGALAIGLVLLLPLRLAIDWLDLGATGLAAREAEGSVWAGRLSEARIGAVPLGDLSARLDPLPLLLGRARIAISRGDEAGDALEGAIGVARHRFGVESVTAHIPLGQRMMPLPIAALDLTDLTIAFRDGLCDRAEGLVKASIAGAPAGISLPGGLSGTARCDGGMVLLPLVSQSGMESLALHVAARGTYRADLRVRPTTPGAGAALTMAGFAPAGDGFVLTVSGRL